MTLKNLRLAALALGLFPIVTSWAAVAQDEAKQWLERMIEAAQTLDYQGKFVYSQGQTLEAMHIVHVVGEAGVRQRLHSLSGAPREVVVADDNVTCVLPKRKIILSGGKFKHSPFPLSLSRELGKLEQYYRFDIVGDDRIANRKTRIIAIRPRDEFRFGYRLWLDHDTGLVLRSALLDEKGRVIEQFMFTDLEVNPDIDVNQWSLPQTTQSVNPPPEVEHKPESVSESQWAVVDLPKGFIQVLHNRFTTDSSDHPTEHIVFTDGLATVSVFVEKLNGERPLLTGVSQMGAMSAFGVVIDKHQALVVGEVPKVTTKLIANSLQHSAPAASQRSSP